MSKKPASPPRQIASVSGDASDSGLLENVTTASLDAYFNSLFRQRDPAMAMTRSLEQMVRIYYRAEAQIRAFDQELDEAAQVAQADASAAPSVAQMNAYPRVLAYWEVAHRAKVRIAYVYDRLLQIRVTSLKTAPNYKKAHAVLHAMSVYFEGARGSDLLALHSLSSELQPVFDHYAMTLKKRHRELEPSMQNGLLSDPEELSDYARDPDIQKELAQRAQDSSNAEPAVESTIDTISQAIRQNLIGLASSGREPQSESTGTSTPSDLRFFPSAGAHGTISGAEYPKNVWSITFDDGPSSKYSPEVLANLQKHGFQATLFELAMNIKTDSRDSLNYLHSGMELGNHSYTHPVLPKETDAQLHHEIVDSTAIDVKYWGTDHKPRLFRCPYGAGLTVPRVRNLIASQGFIHVFWNVDSLDWHDKNPDSILARVKKQMSLSKGGGGIILFHDIHPQSVTASNLVMDHFQAAHIRQARVGDVIDELNHAAQTPAESQVK